MGIYAMTVNHVRNPLGFRLDTPSFQYKVSCPGAKRQTAAQLRVYSDAEGKQLLFDSGKREDLSPLGYIPSLSLTPRTRLWWNVTVWTDSGEILSSPMEWFETGKMNEPWQARWIAAPRRWAATRFFRDFSVSKSVRRARLYLCGLGIYEAYLGNARIGNEYFAPGCTAYDQWYQAQTYDVTELIEKENRLCVHLGDGWYMGRFGYPDNTGDNYGSLHALLAELHLEYEDGTREVIATDKHWMTQDSPVRFSSIYDGEVYDGCYEPLPPEPAVLHDLGFEKLSDRLSLPVIISQRMRPAGIITTPKGETVVDMGQIITGHLAFRCRAPKGKKLYLQYGEVLQDGCFYRDNLRSAKAEYTLISQGEDEWIRPLFTFYGFRYVKLEGFEGNLSLDDFEGCVLHSDVSQTLWLETSSSLVNRFFLNVLWGQRGNFLDVPTDCPQRDERLGWTGDAQAFCGTACFQMDCAAFYAKYLHDMRQEQLKYDGGVPHVVPAYELGGESSCAWADAACIMPWTLYLAYGDKELLRRHYPLMKDWVEFVRRKDHESGDTRLWQVGFHFADWLALDTENGSPIGGTDSYYVASAYYFYSTSLLAKAAAVLGYEEDEKTYSALREEIRQALQKEFFTASGRLAVTTQTAYLLALFFGFAPENAVPRLVSLLDAKFDASDGQLRTGFVGTIYLCRALTRFGLNHRAYSLFLREDYPGWLYEVKLGATTVWERWNSILPDGKISDTGMNSLNHYAYGAVMEWVYRDAAGLNPLEEAPGFEKVRIEPHPDMRLKTLDMAFESPMGRYRVAWKIKDETHLEIRLEIPFGAQAQVVLPAGRIEGSDAFVSCSQTVEALLSAGEYLLTLEAEDSPWFAITEDTPFSQIQSRNPVLWKDVWALLRKLPSAPEETALLGYTLRRLNEDAGFSIPPDTLSRVNQLLR